MVQIKIFTFNPFYENTYVLWDETKEAIIIDPGCYDPEEKAELRNFIEQEALKPVQLINTHAHIDHVLGNAFVAKTWSLELYMHKADLPTLHSLSNYAHLFGLNGPEPSPEPSHFLEEGDVVSFGNTELEVLFVPGHAPGHIALVHHEQRFTIAGDVLFKGSIGRVDLPGGSMEVLLKSIREKLFPLGDDYLVFPGHGPSTSIREERLHNPFFQ